MYQMLQLCVLNELRDFDYHNYISLDEEWVDELINHIVIYFQVSEITQID
jgi:hypothetical protein